MKKVALLLIAIGLSTASCKKSHTCECTLDYQGIHEVTTKQLSKTNEKTAQAICSNETTVVTYNYPGATSSTDTYFTICKLK